ncbi:MAG: hypothetical protein ACI4F9_00945 [Lachnospiraceae bacterium]
MKRIKCKKCKKTLMFAIVAKAEVKCPYCKMINYIEINPKSEPRATPRP